jgi:predicted N-formylglutamate amidohydrolase
LEKPAVVVTCEHGGNRVPPRWAPLFRGKHALLSSHRGFDAGALLLARDLARALRVPLVAATSTRLLVDLNRSLGHPALFSAVTRRLPSLEREDILERCYLPYRRQVATTVRRRIDSGRAVVHVSSHSFVPRLDGVVREVDVGVLFDPSRRREVDVTRRWLRLLRAGAPGLRFRSNQPYRGTADGLTTGLRKIHGDAEYAGIEVEVNQAIVAGGPARWRSLRELFARTLRAAVAPGP